MFTKFFNNKNGNGKEWYMNDQNALEFTCSEKVHKKKYAAASVFDHPVVSYILMFACLFVDLALFYQLLNVLGVDAWYITLLGVLGFAIGYDVGPVYIGSQLKKMKQGLDIDRSNKFFILVLVIAFVVTTFVNLFMRIALRTSTLPNTTEIEDYYTLASWAYAVFCFIIPIVTSVVSFSVSFFNSDPLRVVLMHSEEREMMIKDRIRQLEGTLAEYIPDEDFRKQLVISDDDLCLNKMDMVDEKALAYCYYVRKRIKEHLGDPADISELSKDIRQEVMAKLHNDSTKTQTALEVDDSPAFAVIG